MKFFISDGNIMLEPDKNSSLDTAYLYKVKPHRLDKNGIRYKLPLTKTALLEFLNFYNIDPSKNPSLNELLINLDLALNWNAVELPFSKDDRMRPYQYQGVSWINWRLPRAHGLGLLWAMRTGKTRTTVLGTNNYNKIIVLALSGQEANWADTYKEFSDHTIINLHKLSPSKRKEAYETFNKTAKCVLVGSVNTLTNDALKEVFNPSLFDILVIDEVHKLKNHKTQLNKGAKLIRSQASYCIGLTGTPVSKNINEMINLYALIWPKRFTKTYLSHYFFNQEYNAFSKYGTAGELKEEKKQEWLEFVALYFSQVTREQALPWAKDPLIQEVQLTMNKKQRDIYENCLVNFEIEQKDGKIRQIQEVIAQMTYLREIITDPALIDAEAPSIKEEWLLEFLEQDEERDGIIVFSTHTSYLNKLYEKIKNKYRVCLITGETPNKTEIANKFQQGEYDIVLANIQAGSKGITLDRADTMIFMDQDWRPDENAQAIERFTPTTEDRIKFRQVYKLMVTDLFDFDGIKIKTIDEYMDDVVTGKIKQTELINNFKEIFKQHLK